FGRDCPRSRRRHRLSDMDAVPSVASLRATHKQPTRNRMTLDINSLTQQRVTDNLQQLLQVLPPDIRISVEAQPDQEELLEIVLDLGREPEARFPLRVIYLTERLVDSDALEYVTSRAGEFGRDNRVGTRRPP